MVAGKTEQILLVSFCALILIPLLYLGRLADDNTLTSWKWVFSASSFLKVFFIVGAALPCAYALSRLRFAGHRAYAFLAALSGLCVVPLWQGPEAVIDASRYFVQAKYLSEYGVAYFLREWGGTIPAWTDLPLLPFLYGLIFTWFGEERTYIQVFNTLLFSLSCVLTLAIGKRLWDGETGLNAGLLLLGIPYLLTQVPLMLVDVPTMFFLTLCVYLFMRFAQNGGLAWAGAFSASLVMALLSKFSAWLMLLVLLLIPFVFAAKDRTPAFGRLVLLMLVAAATLGTFACLYFDSLKEQLLILGSYQWSGLGRWQEGYLSTFLFQSHPFLILLALLGTYRAVRARERRFLVAGWFALVVFLLQIKRIRYVIPLLPLFALMAAYGLNAIRDQDVRRFICLCAAASSVVIAAWAYVPFLSTTSMANLQHAGRYLDSLDCDPVVVYALPQKDSSGSTFPSIPILDYHTRKRIISPQEWPGHAENGETRRSSLRFTWEMGRPEFYSGTNAATGCALAIISSEAVERAPEALTAGGRRSFDELQRFDLSSGVFKYQSRVTIFKEP